MTRSPIVDTAVNVTAAITAPVLALLIDVHAITAQVGTDLGAVIAAGVTAYHAGNLTARRAEARRPKVVATVVRPEAEVTASPGSQFVGSEPAVVTPGTPPPAKHAAP